ncbi:unnamed protein product [Bursaphelenchus xylophilus]|uniref:(pine wood nematode) hypothetical protein n=1 Tax=Bursaphelenchus xylophilus TaxID=6326 RepID=A0A1I7S2W9_BURXY|nr:unnamed protein product [Bursaphelenchus xylophilus]CAG9116012.1 unnamed protein product [Bursaphelenchus xylophilus]
MGLFTGILLAIAVLGVSSLKNCTVDDLKNAQAVFGKKLGLDSGKNWNHPLALLEAIHGFYAKDGDRGIVDVCNAINSELDFLNAKQIDLRTCFDPRFLLANDDTPEHALHYISVVSYLRFQCGAGFYTAAQNWQCISETFRASASNLIHTVRDVVNKLANTDLFQFEKCEVIKQGERPYFKPFQDRCRVGPVTYFACESYNTFFTSVLPDCRSECKIST